MPIYIIPSTSVYTCINRYFKWHGQNSQNLGFLFITFQEEVTLGILLARLSQNKILHCPVTSKKLLSLSDDNGST